VRFDGTMNGRYADEMSAEMSMVLGDLTMVERRRSLLNMALNLGISLTEDPKTCQLVYY
jgi:hypothetical protein